MATIDNTPINTTGTIEEMRDDEDEDEEKGAKAEADEKKVDMAM